MINVYKKFTEFLAFVVWSFHSYSAPNPELSRFAGRAVFNYGVGNDNEEIYPLTPDQFIFRGSILRNTTWIYGMAVYTGKETKMVQNWKNKRYSNQKHVLLLISGTPSSLHFKKTFVLNKANSHKGKTRWTKKREPKIERCLTQAPSEFVDTNSKIFFCLLWVWW